MTAKPVLVVMAKAPICGAVKTRLARDIGLVAATGLYRHLTATALRNVGGDPRWTTILAVSPDVMVHGRFEAWRGAGLRLTQGRSDLGARMRRLLAMRSGPVIVVGSDIPFITRDVIWHALKLCRGSGFVLGPAEDGGFWLIGSARRTPAVHMFRGVRWSTPNARSDVLANLGAANVTFAASRYDIDGLSDYRRFLRARFHPEG
jgi:rSAM/selenodomain-associated transferase 1